MSRASASRVRPVFLSFPRVSMIDLDLGDGLPLEPPIALLFQVDLWGMVQSSGPAETAVLLFLFCFSIYSWTVIFSKWQMLRGARQTNSRFLRAFPKSHRHGLRHGRERAVPPFSTGRRLRFRIRRSRAAGEGARRAQQPHRPRAHVADRRQRGTGQARAQHELARDDGFGYAIYRTARARCSGIIRAFLALSAQGSTSLRTVGPGIAQALVATAVGLFAAIPAAIAYNYFGHNIREIGARMDDFALEFLNLAERNFGEPR